MYPQAIKQEYYELRNLGYTQKQCAERLKISIATAKKWERQAKPELDALKAATLQRAKTNKAIQALNADISEKLLNEMQNFDASELTPAQKLAEFKDLYERAGVAYNSDGLLKIYEVAKQSPFEALELITAEQTKILAKRSAGELTNKQTNELLKQLDYVRKTVVNLDQI